MKKINAYRCKLTRHLGEISNLVTKIGGLPTILNPIEWPICKQCGSEMNFIGQISLKLPIKFSKFHTMAYVFMCPGKFDSNGLLMCETWAADSGANIVILQRGGDTLKQMIGGEILPDYRIKLKKVREPIIEYLEDEIDDDIHELVFSGTKIGGIPMWLQNNETPICPVCGKPMKFIAQIISELDGPLSKNPLEWNDKLFLDFGGAGTGYIFICEDECSNPNGAFLWQCF